MDFPRDNSLHVSAGKADCCNASLRTHRDRRLSQSLASTAALFERRRTEKSRPVGRVGSQDGGGPALPLAVPLRGSSPDQANPPSHHRTGGEFYRPISGAGKEIHS